MLGRHLESVNPTPAGPAGEEDEFDEEEYFELDQEERSWLPRRPSSSKKMMRQVISEEYAVKIQLVHSIIDDFGFKYEDVHQCFASRKNHRFPSFWTREDNAFRKRWTWLQLWANPPWSVLDKVFLKLISDRV